MRRITWILAIVLTVSVVLAGCGGGKKDANSVAKDLDKLVGKMESYSTTGTMTLNTGIQPQKYDVEVWYQKPEYYRIKLSNADKDISQIVLKNDDGVFVLTPHLNKSFRFQSDWPKNQGQWYLFQSLVESISKDNERQFTTDGDSYVFDVVANYQNASLARQKIWLNQKDLKPQHVEISDESGNVLVLMDFNNFELNKAFEKDSFDMQRNMTSERIQSLPVMADQKSPTKDADASKQTPAKPAAPKQQPLVVIEPTYIPEGVNKPTLTETKLGENKAVLLKYGGKYNYNLLLTHPNEQPVSMVQGTIVDLGYTLGVLSGKEKEQRTLTWMYGGTEYRLSSGDLPQQEMVKIAMAVQDQAAK